MISLSKRSSKVIVVTTILVTILFTISLKDLRVENEPGRFELRSDDPVSKDLRNFQETFDIRSTMVVGVGFADHSVNSEDLRLLCSITDSLQSVNGVTTAQSIATMRILKRKWLLGLRIPQMTRIYDPDKSDSATVKDILRLHSSYGNLLLGNLVSEDSASVAIVLDVAEDSTGTLEGSAFYRELVIDVKSVLNHFQTDEVTFHLAGTPLLAVALDESLINDLRLIAPLSLVTFFIILMLLFRSWHPAISVFALALTALIWSLGWLSVTGTAMSIGLAIIVPLILAISLTHGVHYIVFLFRRGRTGQPTERDVYNMLNTVGRPALISALTTIVGFLSLAGSSLVGIREIGVSVAVGVAACWYLNGVFFPSLIVVFPSLLHENREFPFLARVANLSHTWTESRGILIICIAALLAALSSYGIGRVRTETNNLEYFPVGSELRQGVAFVDSNFGGVLPIELMITGPLGDEPNAIAVIEGIVRDLRSQRDIGSVVSVIDILQAIDPAKAGDSVLFSTTLSLDSNRITRRMWTLIEHHRGGPRLLVTSDSTRIYRIACRARSAPSDDLAQLTDSVRTIVNRNSHDRNVIVTGMVPFLIRINEYVVSTQIRSFAIALLVTLFLLVIVSRKLVLAACVVVVNVTPVIAILGLMGWASIPLDFSTVMIASIAIGMIVDDTIHFVTRYKRGLEEGRSVSMSLRYSLERVGPPMIATTVVLAIGFAVLTCSQFVPTQIFGLLTAVTVAGAGVADLVLLPTVLTILSRWKFARRELEGVRLKRSE